MILENLRNYCKIGGSYSLGGNVTFRGDIEVWMKLCHGFIPPPITIGGLIQVLEPKMIRGGI